MSETTENKQTKMNIRAKISCNSITKTTGQEEINFSAVVSGNSDENKSYSKYTPTLSLRMVVTNEAVFGAFVPGKEYYLDFAPTETQKASA